MRVSWRIGAALGITGLLAVAGCSSSSKSSTGTNTTAATSPATTSAGGETSTTAAPSKYKATATPTTGLKAGSAVTVTASNFTAGKKLGINECAQKGNANVGAEDCDLGGIVVINVGANGTGTGVIKVKTTGIGSNNHNCMGATTRCFLSVGELSADPNAERADDVNLHFS